MKPLDYDLKIIKTVCALRGLRRIKQQEVADALFMERSTYCKIENGERALSPGQLQVIARLFKTSVFQIIAIAEADESINFKATSLSQILIDFLAWQEGKSQKVQLTEEEMIFLIKKIKNSYYSKT